MAHGATVRRSAEKLNRCSWLWTKLRTFHARSLCLQQKHILCAHTATEPKHKHIKQLGTGEFVVSATEAHFVCTHCHSAETQTHQAVRDRRGTDHSILNFVTKREESGQIHVYKILSMGNGTLMLNLSATGLDKMTRKGSEPFHESQSCRPT